MDAAPPRTLGILIGVTLLLAGLAAMVLGVAQLAQASISAALLLWAGLPIAGAALAALAAYRLYGLGTARYLLNRNGIGIRWGLAVEEMPLPTVRLELPPKPSGERCGRQDRCSGRDGWSGRARSRAWVRSSSSPLAAGGVCCW